MPPPKKNSQVSSELPGVLFRGTPYTAKRKWRKV